MNAELLIMFTLGCDRAYLYAHPERELTSDETRRYDEALARRATGVPAQYITGRQEFWGLDLIVSPAVLIPRPETEHVVEAVLEIVSAKPKQNQEQDQRPRAGAPAPHDSSLPHGLRIADVGTGSGAIALALAKELPTAEIHATDISRQSPGSCPRQCRTAPAFFANRISADRPARRRAWRIRLCSFQPSLRWRVRRKSVQLEVRKFEPRKAVFAGPTGVEVIARLIPQAQTVLKPSGWLIFEVSGTIADSVRKLMSNWDGVSIKSDLQGIPRVVQARKTTRG